MPENLLTDAKVRSAKPTDRDWKLSDGGGLFLLIAPNCGKLWRWKYLLQGKENLSAIGSFPGPSIGEARTAQEKARALVKQGIRAAHERRQIKETRRSAAAAPTLGYKPARHKQQGELAAKRRRLHCELFNRRDQVGAQHNILIEQLRGKLPRHMRKRIRFTVG